MASSENSQLLHLALQITRITREIKTHFEESSLEEPEFSTSSTDVPNDAKYNVLRDTLNDVANDLLLLVNGPRTHARRALCAHHELAAYQVAFEYKLFEAIPESGNTDLITIAERVQLDQDVLKRVMYLLCTQRVFQEVEDGKFAHTHGSVVFLRDADLRAAAEYQLDEFFRAASHTASSLKASTPSPFHDAHGMSLFDYYQSNPKLGARFASAMAGIARLDRQMSSLIDGYPWADLGDRPVVDVGGGSGHVSIELAKRFPTLRVVVQDRNPVMFQKRSSEDLGPAADRVSFMNHDFFDKQPVNNAGAFILRQVTHNWCDIDCIRIFRALLPAMEAAGPETPLLINDTIIPDHGTTSRYQEQLTRQVDIMMLVALRAKQRTEKQFGELLHRADARFKIRKSYSHGTMGLLEIYLN